MGRLTIIGAGSWGSALARILGDNGHSIILYDTDKAIVDEINNNHTNLSKLPNGKLPMTVKATVNLSEAINSSENILLAVPTKVIRSVLKEINQVINSEKLFINASKGIEPDTYKRVSEIVYEEIDNKFIKEFVVLTGPSHAEEVIEQRLTCVAAACNNIKYAKFVQKLFSNNSYFRVYTLNDLVGAELGGSLKNIYAIASGMLYGLGFGDNARAALITRALAEMRRLAVAMGANEKTLFGLTGVGDLIVTTTSMHSRNFQAGVKLATGKDLEETISSMSMVVEGARTVVSAYFASKELKIETPIIDAVYEVIYLRKPVFDAIKQIMNRTLKDED